MVGALLGLAVSTWVVPSAAQKSWPGLPSKNARSEFEEEREQEAESNRLGGDELRARFPDLRLRREPRVAQGSLGFGIRALYLLFDVEGTLDLYPVPWLRLGFVYGAGLTAKYGGKQSQATFAQYGEAVVGLRFVMQGSEVDADLQLSHSIGNYGEALPSFVRPSSGRFADVERVWLPSSHQLFVEGGAFTGFIGLQACTANCQPYRTSPPQFRELSRQRLVPFAGFRYVYYSEALMDKPTVNRVRYGQVFARALLHTYNQPAVDAYFLNGDRVKSSEVGVMVGGEAPLSPFCAMALLGAGCAQASMSIGYTPFPAFLSFEAHLRFPIR